MVDRQFAAAPSIGFRRSTAIDDSPRGLRQTQLAVDRAKGGDQEALRFLYLSYSNNVYRYVRSIVRDDYEAEDVTQHVFAKLITHLDRYNERGVPFFAWLIRLTHNVAIDHLRANRLTPVETVINPDIRCETDLDRAPGVKDALAALPSEQREVIVLRHTERAARGHSPTSHNRALPTRNRGADGPDRGLNSRFASPRQASTAARAHAARLRSGHASHRPTRGDITRRDSAGMRIKAPATLTIGNGWTASEALTRAIAVASPQPATECARGESQRNVVLPTRPLRLRVPLADYPGPAPVSAWRSTSRSVPRRPMPPRRFDPPSTTRRGRPLIWPSQ